MNLTLVTPIRNCCILEQCEKICPVGGEATSLLYVMVFGGIFICLGMIFLFGRQKND